MFTNRFATVALASACSVWALPVAARTTKPDSGPEAPAVPAPRSSFHADIELDPAAYALDGFSLHTGIGWSKLRVDLGVFGLRVPEFVHQQRDFEVAFDGYGVKVQYFPFAEQRGAFFGVDGGVSRADIRLKASQLAARDTQFTLGVNAGWRFDLIGGLYATPWLGVAYTFDQEDVTLGGKTFAGNPVVVFPTVHLGYHVR